VFDDWNQSFNSLLKDPDPKLKNEYIDELRLAFQTVAIRRVGDSKWVKGQHNAIR